MIALYCFLLSIVAVENVGAIHSEDHVFPSLLKRQEPGTPSYNCHDNCGTAITISKAGGDVCNNQVFLTDYKACLQCAGPDNYNIWKYYGTSLTQVASGCGLSTEPLPGKQDEPAEALHPSTSSAAAQPVATSSAETPMASSSNEISTTFSPDASSTVLTYIETASPTTTAAIASNVPVVPNPSSNGTATFTSSPPQQTANAANLVDVSMGVLGAAILAVMHGLRNWTI